MTKRNLFISIGIGILMFAVLVFLFIGKLGNKNNIQNANQPSASNPAILPAGTKNSQQNIQTVENDIKNSLQEPISNQNAGEGANPIDFKDQNGKIIPLSDFETATGIGINKQLRSFLSSTDYNMYYCSANGNEKYFAIYFGYDAGKGYGNLYSNTVTWMNDWEKTILHDLHAILFPDISFSEEELNQQLRFKDGKFRYADVHLPGGKISSINYHVSDNGVIISVSPLCMERLIGIYEPLEP